LDQVEHRAIHLMQRAQRHERAENGEGNREQRDADQR
jgi:hypothetical protein